MKPAEERALAGIRAELDRVIRYDDESIVNGMWIRQRYDCGCFPAFAPARTQAVETAWHEAGHAVAALAVGARFSSASIHHACGKEGRVHGISGSERPGVRHRRGRPDRGAAADLDHARARRRPARLAADLEERRRGRAALPPRPRRRRFGSDECGAWRYSERLLTPLRLKIRAVARALLVHSAVPALRRRVGDRRGQRRWRMTRDELLALLPGQVRRVAGRAVGERRRGEGRQQDLRVPRRRSRAPRSGSSAARAGMRPTSGCCATPTTRRSCRTSAGPAGTACGSRGAIPDDELLEAVDASYDAVVSKLPKKDRPARPWSGQAEGHGQFPVAVEQVVVRARSAAGRPRGRRPPRDAR